MPADVVLSATPIDLTRVLKLDKPVVRVRYELEEVPASGGPPSLTELARPDRRAGPGRAGRRGTATPEPEETTSIDAATS